MAQKEIKVVINGEEFVSVAAKKAEEGMGGFMGKIKGWVSGFADLNGAWNLLKQAVGTVTGYMGHAFDEAEKAAEGMAALRLAVTSSGASWEMMSPAIDDTITKLARLTKFTDDDLARTLQQLILKTGDASWSLNNLGQVADLAAAAQVPLEVAAQALAKAHEGNTKQLFMLIPALKGSADIAGDLQRATEGAAEAEAKASGARVQVKKQLDEVAEAIGRAVMGSDAFQSSGNFLADMLARLATWIDKNNGAVNGLITFLGGALKVVGAFGGVITEAMTNWRIVADGVAASWAGMKYMWAKLTGDTKGAAELKEEMLKLAHASADAYAALKDGKDVAEKHAKALDVATAATDKTTLSTDGHSRGLIVNAGLVKSTAEAIKQKAKDEKDAAEKAEKAWKAYMEGVIATDKATAEVVKHAQEQFPQFNKLVTEGTKKDRVEALSTAMDGVRTSTDRAIKAITSLPLVVPPAHATLDKLKGVAKDVADNLDIAWGAALDFAGAMGGLDGKTQILLTSMGNLAKAAGKLFTDKGEFSVVGLAGVVGALASIASNITAGDAERRQLLKDNNTRLRELRDRVGDLDLNVKGSDLADAKSLLERVLPGKDFSNPLSKDLYQVPQQLIDAGFSLTKLQSIAESLGMSLKDSKGVFHLENLSVLLKALGNVEPGRVGQSFREQYDFFKKTQELTGATGAGQLSSLSDFLVNNFKASGLRGLVNVGDLSGSRQNLLNLFTSMNNGLGLSASQLGGLTGREFQDVLLELIGLIDKMPSQVQLPGGTLTPGERNAPHPVSPLGDPNSWGIGSGGTPGTGVPADDGITPVPTPGGSSAATKSLSDVVDQINAQTTKLGEYHVLSLNYQARTADATEGTRAAAEMILQVILQNTGSDRTNADTALGRQVAVDRRLLGDPSL